MRTRDYDTDFLDRAGKTRAWGIVLLAAASFLWLWGAALLVLPNGPCESRLFTDGATANTGDWSDQSCQRARDWPKTVALFASSIPVMAAWRNALHARHGDGPDQRAQPGRSRTGPAGGQAEGMRGHRFR